MNESWIESIAKTVQYKLDSLEFLSRVRQQFPSSNPTHSGIVAKLWVTADEMDLPVNNLLLQMNKGLLSHQGEIDITRGASMQPSSSSQIDFGNQFSDDELEQTINQLTPYSGDRLVYECTWSLTWGTVEDEHAIAFRLIAEASSGELRALVNGFNFPENYEITYPLFENELEEALARAYVEEVTANETKTFIQQILDLEQEEAFESNQESDV